MTNFVCVVIERTPITSFFECARFHIQRQVMVNKLLGMCNLSLDTLLYGDTKLSYQQNVEIFQTVQDYILRTKRFS